MKPRLKALAFVSFLITVPLIAQSKKMDSPTWWDKYQYITRNGSDPVSGATSSVVDGTNVDVSNECGPQRETYITSRGSHDSGANEEARWPENTSAF